MELLQLLKTLSDQSSQADMQALSKAIQEAVIESRWGDLRICIIFGICVFIFATSSIFDSVRLYKLDKRIKKIESIGLVKNS